jgi:hypothetical protein
MSQWLDIGCHQDCADFFIGDNLDVLQYRLYVPCRCCACGKFEKPQKVLRDKLYFHNETPLCAKIAPLCKIGLLQDIPIKVQFA